MASWEQRRKESDERKNQEELARGRIRFKSSTIWENLTARERIDLLMDKGTFVEIDKFVTHPNSVPVMKIFHKGQN